MKQQQTIQDKIRQICTYHSELSEGTSGYNLSEEQFKQLFDLFGRCEETDTKQQQTDEWELGFDEALKKEGFEFDGYNWSRRGEGFGAYPLKHIEDFIRDLLARREAEVKRELREKIEEMGQSYNPYEFHDERLIYKKAIGHVLRFLEGKGGKDINVPGKGES